MPITIRRADSASPVPGPDAVEAAPPSDLVWQLWFEQFRQLGWLGVTSAAGTLLLAERGLLTEGRNLGVAVFLFALAAGVAFVGQDALVDQLTEGRSIQRSVKLARAAASALIGLGGGVLLSMVFR